MMAKALTEGGRVLTENGRVIVGADCNCACLGGDGGPEDPPPPVEPGTFYRAAPCDPNAGPLERPVVFFIPPRDQWPPGGYQYNCTSAVVTGANGEERCFGIDGNSPKVEGDVERPPGNPYTVIDGVEYLERTPNPVKLTCCACRPDCGVSEKTYFTQTFVLGEYETPHCGCDGTPDCELPKRQCCCNIEGEINYIADILEYDEDWGFCLNGSPGKTSLRREIKLRGRCQSIREPGEMTITKSTTTTTYDSDCRPLVSQTFEEVVVPIMECGCNPILPADAQGPFECLTFSGTIQCKGFVQYLCSRYTGRKECNIRSAPRLPDGVRIRRWNAEVLFDQGTCLSGCKDESEVIARPGGVDRRF